MYLISEQHNNKAIKITLGDQVALQLPENPTTGYMWNSAEWSFPDDIDLLLNEFKPTDSSVGSGGYHRWVLEPTKIGTFTFELTCQRAWEGRPIKTFVFQLAVEPKPEPEPKKKSETEPDLRH